MNCSWVRCASQKKVSEAWSSFFLFFIKSHWWVDHESCFFNRATLSGLSGRGLVLKDLMCCGRGGGLPLLRGEREGEMGGGGLILGCKVNGQMNGKKWPVYYLPTDSTSELQNWSVSFTSLPYKRLCLRRGARPACFTFLLLRFSLFSENWIHSLVHILPISCPSDSVSNPPVSPLQRQACTPPDRVPATILKKLKILETTAF